MTWCYKNSSACFAWLLKNMTEWVSHSSWLDPISSIQLCSPSVWYTFNFQYFSLEYIFLTALLLYLDGDSWRETRQAGNDMQQKAQAGIKPRPQPSHMVRATGVPPEIFTYFLCDIIVRKQGYWGGWGENEIKLNILRIIFKHQAWETKIYCTHNLCFHQTGRITKKTLYESIFRRIIQGGIILLYYSK